MDLHPFSPQVVVVGGGLAGVTTSAYLARAGVPVRLFEKAPRLGGRASTEQIDGFSFNRGIHALYTGGATSDMLDDFGIRYTAGSPKATFVLSQNQLFAFPASPLELFNSRLLSFGDKIELVRALATVPRLDPHAVAHTSVEAWLDQSIRRPRVRHLLAATARTLVYSAALDLVSAEMFVDKLQRTLKHPVHYIDGGWQTLVNALRAKAEAAGVQIESGVRVEAAVHEHGRVQGVRLHDGNFVPASAVVIATTPREAVKLIDNGNYGPLRDLVGRLVPAQLACLDVALRQLPASPYTIVQDLDQPRFFSTQSLYASIAPQGGVLVHCFKQLDPRTPTDPHNDARELEELLDTALPGWRDVVVKRVFLPRIEAVGTLPTAQSGGFAGRPKPQVPGLSNLYLAGDWIGSEGFLADASTASACQVARLVLERDARERIAPLAQEARPVTVSI